MNTDLSGLRFGNLLVIRKAFSDKKNTHWECLCDCGAVKVINRPNLLNGTKSCGCFRKTGDYKVTHGHTRNGKISTEYSVWHSMLSRCFRPDSKSYKYYGARGITVCNEWMTFSNFYNDMGKRPARKTLDRIDNNGPYTKNNCRWATGTEQALNKRKRQCLESKQLLG